MLDALDSLPSLPDTDGTITERSPPGRSAEDWDELTAWYTGRSGESGPAQLRGAADQALAQLIANAKRMLAATGTGVSRRADLLRLAQWFDASDAKTSHRIFNAAFGAYPPSRHLLRGPDEDNGREGPHHFLVTPNRLMCPCRCGSEVTAPHGGDAPAAYWTLASNAKSSLTRPRKRPSVWKLLQPNS